MLIGKSFFSQIIFSFWSIKKENVLLKVSSMERWFGFCRYYFIEQAKGLSLLDILFLLLILSFRFCLFFFLFWDGGGKDNWACFWSHEYEYLIFSSFVLFLVFSDFRVKRTTLFSCACIKIPLVMNVKEEGIRSFYVDLIYTCSSNRRDIEEAEGDWDQRCLP